MEPTPASGLQESSYARCEDVRSIGEERLVHRIGAVDAAVQAAVDRTLRRVLEP